MKASLALCLGLVGCVAADADEPTATAPASEPAAPTAQPAEQSLNLVARVYRSNGNAVEFYEPIPGAVLVSETGRAGGVFLDRASLHGSIDQLYAAIAPGARIPDRLAQAIARAGTGAGTAPLSASPSFVVDRRENAAPSAPATGVHPYAAGACNQTWFTNTQCNLAAPSLNLPWTWSECLVPWFNGAFGTCNMNGYSLTEFWTSLCADIGNVTLKVTVNPGGIGGTWTVNEGFVRNFDWYRINGDLDGHAEVDNATNDRFLFAVNCLHY